MEDAEERFVRLIRMATEEAIKGLLAHIAPHTYELRVVGTILRGEPVDLADIQRVMSLLHYVGLPSPAIEPYPDVYICCGWKIELPSLCYYDRMP